MSLAWDKLDAGDAASSGTAAAGGVGHSRSGSNGDFVGGASTSAGPFQPPLQQEQHQQQEQQLQQQEQGQQPQQLQQELQAGEPAWWAAPVGRRELESSLTRALSTVRAHHAAHAAAADAAAAQSGSGAASGDERVSDDELAGAGGHGDDRAGSAGGGGALSDGLVWEALSAASHELDTSRIPGIALRLEHLEVRGKCLCVSVCVYTCMRHHAVLFACLAGHQRHAGKNALAYHTGVWMLWLSTPERRNCVLQGAAYSQIHPQTYPVLPV